MVTRSRKPLPGQLDLPGFGKEENMAAGSRRPPVPVPEPDVEEPDERYECAWDVGGDECFTPVSSLGEFCPHHQEVAKANGYPATVPPPEVDELPPKVVTEAVKRNGASKTWVRKGTKGPKKQAPTPLEEKYDRQKRALQALTLATFEWGAREGLTGPQVRALQEALDALGWLPQELRR